MNYPFALQLYSVRDYFEKAPLDAMLGVKRAGFDHVELAGTCGMSPEEFKALLDRTGLTPVSAHMGFAEVCADPAAAARVARVFGVSGVVIPWLGGDGFGSREDWLGAARAMDAAGAALRAEGVTLSYHNHDHEFMALDGGGNAFDLIFSTASPENLKVQLDTCWSTVGGADTPALLARLAGCVSTIHVKDFLPGVNGARPVLTEVGAGAMDWPSVLPAARAAGAQWFIVEQDVSQTDSMDSAAVNAAFMAQWNRTNG